MIINDLPIQLIRTISSPKGYYGTTCEKNHCGTCVHGICIFEEFNDQYECFCANGYTGHGCTEDFNDCKFFCGLLFKV